jgi:hypothetical protein
MGQLSYILFFSGIALFAAFVLTFWSARPIMLVAAVLWAIGFLPPTAWHAFRLFHQGQMASAFSGEPLPLVSWLIPVISMALAIAETVLLFPWVTQKRALRIGKILFLAIVPAVVLLTGFSSMRAPFHQFPLGVSWLAYPLLWFRIRERLNAEAKIKPEEGRGSSSNTWIASASNEKDGPARQGFS